MENLGIELVARNGDAVRQALEIGEWLHLATSSEEITDEFLLFAIESGLLKKWAAAFPDPRQAPEVSFEVVWAASLAARFAGLYSIRKTGYVLQSARVLGALGYSVAVLEADAGISRRGTSDDQALSGDVLRKLLAQLEAGVDEPEVARQRAILEELEATAPAIEVRERASRRAVKQRLNEPEAEARSRAVASQLVKWYNESVGWPILEYARLGKGRRIHLLDTTRIEVELEAGNYECDGVVKNDDGSYSRGYKLGTLRTLTDTSGLLVQAAVGPIQMNDLKLCRELLRSSPALRAGDLLIEDRGFIDGAEITHLKRKRKVDVIVPLRSNMEATQEAIRLAEMAREWEPHPSRPEQEIAWVCGVEHMWDACQVGLNACVIRFWNKKKKATDYIVLVTTDLSLSARWIVRHYEERPELEQDYQQLKSGGWKLQKLSTTRYDQIVFYLLTVVCAYSLYHLFANTQAGAAFADKTREAITLDQLRNQRTHIIVYAGGYFEIFETLSFIHLVLQLPPSVQDQLRIWLAEHLRLEVKRE